jgi:hypothetical protein
MQKFKELLKSYSQLIITVAAANLFCSNLSAAPGDVLETLVINNTSGDGRTPGHYQGIALKDDNLWVVDLFTDRIYKVNKNVTYEDDGVTIKNSPGDSEFSLPLPDNVSSPACPVGICGGGSLTFAGNYLWNASPVTADIVKIDPVSGANLEASNEFTNNPTPAPIGLTHDGTFFWIVDWQSNTINKVLPEDGSIVATIPGPSALPACGTQPYSNAQFCARPFGITWDGVALWVTERQEQRIYRVNPDDGQVLGYIENPTIINDPLGISWDGQHLWITNRNSDSSSSIMKLDSGVTPLGVLGCIEKNGVGLTGNVLLRQQGETDQTVATDSDGCFLFENFASGIALDVSFTESDADTKPIITLNGGDITLIVGETYIEPGFSANDDQDGDISNLVAATPDVINNPSVIDTSTPDTNGITIEYMVTDLSGNAADPVTRTVYVLEADTTPPVITLTGANPLYIAHGDAYLEPGATAFDERDGNLESITVTGSVNTAATGTYYLDYNVSDTSGNSATTVTRTVFVQDLTAPVITLLGSTPVNHEQGNIYNDAGATASDNVDTSVTVSVSGSVAYNTAGTYILNYNATDSSGNNAVTLTRTVLVADTLAPSITLNGSANVNVEQGTSYSDAGATANDSFDGNISANIIVSGDSVDPATAGTYIIRYNVSDAAGNAAAEASRTVTVADTTAPVITLSGNSLVNHEQGTSYTDAGATATDTVDGAVTVNIGGDTVNSATAGTYIITYNAVDAAGNNATQVTRTVVVDDTTAPVITLNGLSSVDVERGIPYIEDGASATDLVDGSVSVTIGGDTVDENTPGTYIITYDAVDKAGNSAVQQTRTVTVADTTPPTLTLLGQAVINHPQDSIYNDAGATASDSFDDDAILTSTIAVSGDNVDVNTVGTYIIQYDVSDSSGNAAAPVSRTVIVEDTTAPIITLTGSSLVTIERGNSYTDAGATASDNNDGDLTTNIATTGSVNTLVAGDYVISYNVSDAAGNAALQVQRTVQVRDTVIPTITLLGSTNVNHEQGTSYTDAGATAQDLPGENITGSIVVSGTVNTSVAGDYILTFNVDDVVGNSALPVTRTVTVADTTAPVITLTGASTINVEQGTNYTEQGATAADLVDVSVTVTIGGDTVDPNVAGTYIITYDAQDTALNSATQVIRTVIVADTIAPTITLIGDTDIDLPLGDLFVEPGYSASDNFDDDAVVTSNVDITGSININVEGTYVLNYDVTDAGGNAAITRTRTVNVVNPTVISFEAETATIGGAHTVESDSLKPGKQRSRNNRGFTGSGYIQHSGEGYVEYTFSAFSVPYDLVVRYAWDTGDRPLEVILNGQLLPETLDFPATGSFDNWLETAAYTLTPESGINTLRLSTTGSSGANLDSITLTPQ